MHAPIAAQQRCTLEEEAGDSSSPEDTEEVFPAPPAKADAALFDRAFLYSEGVVAALLEAGGAAGWSLL